MIFSNRVNDRIERLNYGVAKYMDFNGGSLVPVLKIEEVYAQNQINLAMNYFYDKTSLFYNSTVVTDFKGPKVEIKYKDMVEGRYNFTVSLRNEHYEDKKKVMNQKDKSFIVHTKHIGLLTVRNRPISEIPEEIPEKEVSILKYVTYDGPLVYLAVRDEIDKKWVDLKPRFRITEEKKGESKHSIVLKDTLENSDYFKEEIVSIQNGNYLLLKRLYKKVTLKKETYFESMTLEDIGNTMSLEFKTLGSHKLLAKIELMPSKVGTNCRFFNLVHSPDEKGASVYYVTFSCEMGEQIAAYITKIVGSE